MMEVSGMKATKKDSGAAGFATPVTEHGSCERREPPVKVKQWRWYNINRSMLPSKYLFICHFMADAGYYPFANVFLMSAGLSASQAGICTGLAPWADVIFQPMWSCLAAMTGRHLMIMNTMTIGAILLIAPQPLIAQWILSSQAKLPFTAGTNKTRVTTSNGMNSSNSKIDSIYPVLAADTAGHADANQLLFGLMIVTTFLGVGCERPVGTFLTTRTLEMVSESEHAGRASSFGQQRAWGGISWSITSLLVGWVTQYVSFSGMSDYSVCYLAYLVSLLLFLAGTPAFYAAAGSIEDYSCGQDAGKNAGKNTGKRAIQNMHSQTDGRVDEIQTYGKRKAEKVKEGTFLTPNPTVSKPAQLDRKLFKDDYIDQQNSFFPNKNKRPITTTTAFSLRPPDEAKDRENSNSCLGGTTRVLRTTWGQFRRPYILIHYINILFQGMGFALHHGFLVMLLEMELHATKFQVGLSMSISALAELFGFLYCRQICQKFGYDVVILFGTFTYFVRFMLLGLLQGTWMVLLTQLMHFTSFALSWSATIEVLHANIPTETLTTMMGVAYSFYQGWGGCLPNLIGGYVVEWYGVAALFMYSSYVFLAWSSIMTVTICILRRRFSKL